MVFQSSFEYDKAAGRFDCDKDFSVYNRTYSELVY